MGKKLLLIQFVALLLLLIVHPVPLAAGEVELGQPFPITSAWVGDKVFKPKVAYNSQHREYLVVYHWSNQTLFPSLNRQIHGARISEDGKYLANFVISDLPNDCAYPDVAYDPVYNRYLVVWMWDNNGDGSNWDLVGRFVSREGPEQGASSFLVSQQTLYDEYDPRLVYGEAQKDFLVVTNLLRNDGSSIPAYIIGLRIKADGSGMPSSGNPDFSISNGTENRVNAKVTYNSTQDEYLVVYDNAFDILARRIRGLDASPTGTEIVVAGWPDAEDRPEVSFSSQKDIYVVTWDSRRLSGEGGVYGRFVNGNGSLSTVFRLDDDIGGVRPDFTSAVACKQFTDECLVYWIAVHDNTYFTFGRQLHAGGALEGGFPFVNLNSVASWGSEEPQVSIAAGSRNYFMAYKNNPLGASAISIWGQPTLFQSFQWNLFLPAIINNTLP